MSQFYGVQEEVSYWSGEALPILLMDYSSHDSSSLLDAPNYKMDMIMKIKPLELKRYKSNTVSCGQGV